MVTDTRERFNADKLRVFSSNAFQKLGVPKKDADITAEMEAYRLAWEDPTILTVDVEQFCS